MTIGVSKYGGSSLKNAEMFERTANISLARMESEGLEHLVEVVSAVGKVDDTSQGNKFTDLLENIYYNRNKDENISCLIERVEYVFRDLHINQEVYMEACKSTNSLFDNLRELAKSDEENDRRYAEIVSLGERLTGIIRAAQYKDMGKTAVYLDFNEFGMLTRPEQRDSDILPEAKNLIKQKISERDEEIIIVGGFIGYNEAGEVTTLGRNASDYSATVIGAALDVDTHIYSDKSGLLRADPNFVPDAEPIKQVTYKEAKEFSEVGAGIIHSRAITPAKRARIKIRLLNTFNTEDEGTLISPEIDSKYNGVKAIASHGGYDMLTVTKEDMGEGAFADVTAYFRQYGININAVADCGGEGFSLALRPNGNENYYNHIGHVLKSLRKDGYAVNLSNNHARLALIGEGMTDQSGVLEKFYGVLSRLGIKRSLISQGENSIMLSTFIPEEHLRVTVNKLYDALGFGKNGNSKPDAKRLDK